MQNSVKIGILTPITSPNALCRSPQARADIENVLLTNFGVSDGPDSIENPADVALAVPGSVDAARKAESEGTDAIVIDCMADPALAEVRAATNIPVLGCAETSLKLAAVRCRRFTVLTVNDEMTEVITDLGARYGVGTALARPRSFNVPVLEIDPSSAKLCGALADLSADAVSEDGVDGIILGCTGLTGAARSVQELLVRRGIQAVVVDPLPLAIRVAEAVVRSGLSRYVDANGAK